MAFNKYNKLLTSVKWSTKDPKDAQIIALVRVSHNIMYPNNTSENTSERKKGRTSQHQRSSTLGSVICKRGIVTQD